MDNIPIHIGISGWRYPPWRGVFYPQGLPQRAELAYVASRLPSLEINGSFYSLQRPSRYAQWYAQTPPNFVFAVKASRYITHILRLRQATAASANFFASGLFELREKLGPILWQFPPSLAFDDALFDAFFAGLPHDTQSAATLARHHDDRLARMGEPPSLEPDRNRRLRHAIEVRHDSFACAAFIELARRHNVAVVVADTAGRWPYLEDVTADFMYLRLHGDKVLYASGYTDAALDRWAERIRAWATGGEPADAARVSSRPAPAAATRNIYCYFDNDVKVRAPFDAQALMARLGLRWEPADGPDLARRSERNA
jgi:uncharacterized protein YecE (DUF72 family)